MFVTCLFCKHFCLCKILACPSVILIDQALYKYLCHCLQAEDGTHSVWRRGRRWAGSGGHHRYERTSSWPRPPVSSLQWAARSTAELNRCRWGRTPQSTAISPTHAYKVTTKTKPANKGSSIPVIPTPPPIIQVTMTSCLPAFMPFLSQVFTIPYWEIKCADGDLWRSLIILFLLIT